MGAGKWYGVPNYGEYVMVYYNKDLFEKHGSRCRPRFDEFKAAMDTFVKAGAHPAGRSAAPSTRRSRSSTSSR